MNPEISLCLAGIRPHFWKNLYDSAVKSCTRYTWEMVIVSPMPLPEELKSLDNIKYIYEKGCPTRASQIGAANCTGRLITFPCDDGVFLPNALDSAIDRHNASGRIKDAIVMRYREGAGMNAGSFPESYWYARHHIPVHSLNLGHDWKIAPQPMLTLEYYKEIGGVDCQTFECMSFATHDLCYRLQRDGGVFHISPLEVMNADNYGETGVDHAPIFHAHGPDHRKFTDMYNNPSVRNRVKINFDNYKSVSDWWERRWGKKNV